jgi:hypothetical protein
LYRSGFNTYRKIQLADQAVRLTWRDRFERAVITSVTNAASESLYRLAELEAREAYGLRNPPASAAASGSSFKPPIFVYI